MSRELALGNRRRCKRRAGADSNFTIPVYTVTAATEVTHHEGSSPTPCLAYVIFDFSGNPHLHHVQFGFEGQSLQWPTSRRSSRPGSRRTSSESSEQTTTTHSTNLRITLPSASTSFWTFGGTLSRTGSTSRPRIIPRWWMSLSMWMGLSRPSITRRSRSNFQ